MQRIRLNQHASQVHALQKFPQGSGFAAGIGGVGGLGDRHAKRLGVEAHLGNESGCARGSFRNRPTKRLAVAHQAIEALGDARLGSHPALEERLKGINIKLREQQPERGIGRRLAEIHTQQLVEGLPVPLCETFHPHQGALAAENRQDRHEQHPPLGKPDAAPHAAIRQGLEEADQIGGGSRIGRVG